MTALSNFYRGFPVAVKLLVAILLFAFSLANIITDNTPPAIAISSSVISINVTSRDSVKIVYAIEYAVAKSFSGNVGRMVLCDGEEPYYAGAELRIFTEPKTMIRRFFEYPAHPYAGSKCELVFTVEHQRWYMLAPRVHEIGRVPFTA